jgi:hypothetical protein
MYLSTFIPALIDLFKQILSGLVKMFTWWIPTTPTE